MADEGERVELGWPHAEEDLITGGFVDPAESTLSGLLGSVTTLQGRLASQGDEIKVIQADLVFHRSWLLALSVLATGLFITVITLAVMHGG